VCAGGDGGEQCGGEPHIEHGGFVNNEEVGGEGVVFVGSKAAFGGLKLEKPVESGGVAAGGFGEALGGAARGRGEVYADFLRAEDIH